MRSKDLQEGDRERPEEARRHSFVSILGSHRAKQEREDMGKEQGKHGMG